MNVKFLLPLAVVLSVALGGCTGQPVSSTLPATPSAAAPQAEEGQDVGNSRPTVGYDGLMVRRRVVVAVHSAMDADLAGLRMKLESAAEQQGLTLADMSPDVLEPAILEHVMPEVLVALPASATLDDGRSLVTQVSGPDTERLGAEHFHVLQALIHDLRFSIPTPDPGALALAVDREGILADALGNYRTTAVNGGLDISYTGPLLGDEVVESVRSGIARQAHAAASAVTVEPASTDGAGVDMASEPPWQPETTQEAHSSSHG